MRLTHLGHSCVLVESADVRVLVDPGTFAHDLTGVRDLDLVIVTHQHPDHLDVDRLPALVAANPAARVLCDPGSAPVLADAGVEATVHDGPTTVRDLTVTPLGETHALIHEDVPRIPNVGVRLDADGEPSFVHPGDALDAEPGEVDVLCFPLSAPWAASRDTTAFLRRIDPAHAVPIHDGLLQDRGRAVYLGQAEQLGGERTRVHDLAGEGATEFRAGE
ncbi:MBL fold metallo-hydrolase [Phycicoccus sp. BSK3Z-2]|uniref:MBL fold metallo-hydrolase n=1 Tax=Phycicoccus avicenniae TaxID=2828860 RepID=A0A941DCY1_9MICO|nr:MBL fold metallo-hydrolase [Phycicoccus avicenniae]MBR7744042.1 MBL fold metallo-hydrolase [Phycicoccus avicenniae]